MQTPYAPYAPPQQQAAFVPSFRYEPLGGKTSLARFGILALPPAQIALSVASLAFGDSLRQDRSVLALIGVASFAVSIFGLATAVLFLVWTHQAAKNVRAFGQQGLSYSPGWCVAWWFIPIASLWMPYLAFKEIWRASDPETAGADPSAWKTGRVPSLFAAWWIAYLLNSAVSTAEVVRGFVEGLRVALAQQPATGPQGTHGTVMVGHFFFVIAAVCIASIMQKLARRQEVSWEKIQARAAQPSDGWSGYGPPGGSGAPRQ